MNSLTLEVCKQRDVAEDSTGGGQGWVTAHGHDGKGTKLALNGSNPWLLVLALSLACYVTFSESPSLSRSFGPQSGKKGVELDILWSHLHTNILSKLRTQDVKIALVLSYKQTHAGPPVWSTYLSIRLRHQLPPYRFLNSSNLPKESGTGQQDFWVDCSLPSLISLEQFPRAFPPYRSVGDMPSNSLGKPRWLANFQNKFWFHFVWIPDARIFILIPRCRHF